MSHSQDPEDTDDDQGPAPDLPVAWDLTPTDLSELPVEQQLLIAVRDLVHLQNERRAMDQEAYVCWTNAQRAIGRRQHLQVEVLSALRHVCRHPWVLRSIAATVLVWGVGSGIYFTGFQLAELAAFTPWMAP